MNLNVPNDPNYWRKQAEDAWSLAEEMTDADCKEIMANIAQGYEMIGRRFERST
jgi:hypothetical protein